MSQQARYRLAALFTSAWEWSGSLLLNARSSRHPCARRSILGSSPLLVHN